MENNAQNKAKEWVDYCRHVEYAKAQAFKENTWKPQIDQQEKEAREKDIAAGKLPF